MPSIHPTAIVEPGARLAENVTVGPFSMIGAEVELKDGVEILSHVVVAGRTTIGDGTRIFPFASIGHQPQDLKYAGEPSTLQIGERNIIREHVTMNTGTEGGGMVTSVGDDCLFMVGAHVAHDCRIGNQVIMANNATLAGHVTVHDHAIVGGLSAVHQFVRIGMHAMIGGMSGVEHDVIPYGLVMGDRARLNGLNLIGLRRRGFGRSDVDSLRKAYAMLFGTTGTMADRLTDVDDAFGEVAPVRDLVDFVKEQSQRALCLPRAGDDV